MSQKSEPVYMDWLKLLRGIPELHAVKVKNRYVAVTYHLSTLQARGYISRHEFRAKQLEGKDSCLIFHHSIQGFGKLVESKPLGGKHFHDWDQILTGVPPGFGRQLLIDYNTVRTAIWQRERKGKVLRGEYRVIPVGSKNRGRAVLFHDTSESANTLA